MLGEFTLITKFKITQKKKIFRIGLKSGIQLMQSVY